MTDIGVANGKWAIYEFSPAGEFAVGSSPVPPEQTDPAFFNFLPSNETAAGSFLNHP